MNKINPYKYASAVVLGNGDFPKNEFPLSILKRAESVTVCDGAANEFVLHGGKPDVIIGDGDSLNPEIRDLYKDIFVHIAEQETNDQTKAVTYLSKKGVREIAILGATGKREDHTLGNISLLVEYFKSGLDVRIFTDYGVFVVTQGDTEFEVKAGKQISIFNFGCTQMQSENLKYPLYPVSNWWQGTLNEALEDTFTLRTNGIFMIFAEY